MNNILSVVSVVMMMVVFECFVLLFLSKGFEEFFWVFFRIIVMLEIMKLFYIVLLVLFRS